MNSEPHTHEVKIRSGDGRHYIQYGDTHRSASPGWMFFLPEEWRIRRKVRLAIKEHDKGSIRAGKRRDMVQKIAEEMRPPLLESEVVAAKELMGVSGFTLQSSTYPAGLVPPPPSPERAGY
jgi:hypothetical protein